MSEQWKKVAKSDLNSVALELAENLEKPALIILTGEMGAGKTTFVKYFVEANFPNFSEEVMSPTYSLISEYGPVVHADFYRLESPHEIQELELELYLDHTNFFFIEWGKDYIDTINRAIEFKSVYELKIEIVSDYRNFTLSSLSRD